ncbi:MAG: PQQ-binding-like beta-propeller repeat protein [Bacteroidales bacterium]
MKPFHANNRRLTYLLGALLAGTTLWSQQPTQAFSSQEDFARSFVENRQWPSYRGYYASGWLDGTGLPERFDLATGSNVRWTLPIPGLGLSCPVIWDNRVFVTTAISDRDTEGYKTGMYGDIAPVADSSEHRWIVYCIDKSTGTVLWEREAHRGVPLVKRHPKSSHANTSVATDGRHVVAFFGSEGLYCYDMEGTLLWKRDFGLIQSAWDVVPGAEWEFCSSPLISGEKLILQADGLNQAFVAALNIRTGETLWRKERKEIATWCTPNLYYDGPRARVVVNGYKHRGAYDLETGEEVWSMDGGGDIPVPAPIVWNDLVFFNSAHGKFAPLMAVHTNATGVIPFPEKSEDAKAPLAWFHPRNGAYMSSVLVYKDLLYQIRWNGSLQVYRAATGEEVYKQTVEVGSFIASPVASDDRIYLVSETGDLFVVRAGTEYELLEKIPLGEPSLVTPALSDGVLILRTAGKLIAVSGETSTDLRP